MEPPDHLQYPVDGWTRLFAFTPFVVAAHVPWPVTFLQLFYGAAWLANGLAIAYLARVLGRGSRAAPFVAGCLMLTATSDFQTDLLVYGPHLFGVALFFFGAAVLARTVEPGAGAGRALTATVLLAVSFFTVGPRTRRRPSCSSSSGCTRDRSATREYGPLLPRSASHSFRRRSS